MEYIKSISNIVSSLFDAIFGKKALAAKSEIPAYDYKLEQIVVKSGKAQIVEVKVKDVEGHSVSIDIQKRCMASYLGLPQPKYFLFDKKDDKAVLLVRNMWDVNKWVVFGSAIKGDDKMHSKFYAYQEITAKRILGNSAADWSAYGGKLFTDLKFIKEANALVLSYKEYVERLRAIGFYGPIEEPGNDGSAVCRHDFAPQTDGFAHDQIIAVPNKKWGQIYDSGNDLNMPLLKGAVDTKLITNEQFDAAFGYDYEIVLIKKDMIKVNYDYAESGSWLVGFTWNTEKPFDLNVQWEVTQFLGTSPEVRDYLLSTQKIAIDKANDMFSTKEKVIEYLGAKIADKNPEENRVIETKLLAAIMSNLPYEFVWIQNKIEEMKAREIFDAVKCYGIKLKGAVLWTDNVHCNSSIRWMSKEQALSIGGDNDHDLYGYAVSNKIGKMILMRYPMVAGFEFRDIPKNIHVEDHFPEFVELAIKHAVRIPFNRNMIKDNATRITDGVEYTRHIATRLVKDSGIGLNTIKLKRLCSRFYDTKNIAYIDNMLEAAYGIEAGAVGLKFNVKAPKKSVLPEDIKLSVLYPMEYRDVKAKCAADFNKDFGSSDLDSILFTAGYKHAYGIIASMKTRHPKDIMVDTSKATKITDAFMKRVHEAIYYYNTSITSAIAIQNAELRTKTITGICDSVSMLGRNMSIGELQTAISQSFMAAGELSTGAFGIHIAGHRIFEVFGTDLIDVEMSAPRDARSQAIYVYANKEVDIENLNKEEWSVNTDGNIVMGDVVLQIGKGMRIPQIKDITVIANYKKQDMSISKKAFWLTAALG